MGSEFLPGVKRLKQGSGHPPSGADLQMVWTSGLCLYIMSWDKILPSSLATLLFLYLFYIKKQCQDFTELYGLKS
jgi:hypothetical protein